MKKLLTLLLIVPCLAFAQPKQKPGVVYDAVITRVIDGDTVGIAATWLPAPLKQELSIRVFGVDTPEKGHRAQCPSEAQRGEAELQDADGNVMTADAAQEFVRGLP